MSIKWMIKKSDFYEVRKSVSKEADSKTLEQLKKEVIAILENKDSQEYKKAIEHFEKDESKYSRLEKSVTGEWIEKAGYGVGTVRIWKGKKYKKIAQNKWVRVFDKNDRGAATSMGKYIAQVKKCSSVEELYQFCMKQRSLFQDENGVDLPIMDKLKAAIDEQSGKIESGDKLNSRMKEYQKEDLAKLKAGNYSFDSFADFKAEIKKQGNDFRGSKQPNYIGYLSQYNDNYLQQVYDSMPKRELKEDNPDYPFKPKTEKERAERAAFEKDRDDFIERMDKIRQEEKQKNTEKYDDDKAYEEYQKLLMKENPTNADNSRIGELVKEHYKHSKKEWIGGKGLKELNEAKDDSKVLSNGKTVKEVREQYGIKADKKETEKFWDGKVESDDGEGEFVAEMKGVGGGLYRNRFKTRAAAEKSVKNHQALGFESHVVEDKKESEKENSITTNMGKKITESELKDKIKEKEDDVKESQKMYEITLKEKGENSKYTKQALINLNTDKQSLKRWNNWLDAMKNGDIKESDFDENGNKKDVSKMSKDEILSEMAKQVKLKNNRDENYYENLKNELDKINKIADQARKDAGDKINVDDFTLNKLGKKIDGEYPRFNKEQQKKLFSRIIEEFGESEKARKLIQNMQDFNSQKGESLDINSYGDTWDYMKKQVGVGEPEKETYWIKDKGNNRITSEDAKNRIKSNLSQIDAYNNLLKDSDKADSIKWNTKKNQLLDDNKYLMGRLNSDDRKKMESESEKTKSKMSKDALKKGLLDLISILDEEEIIEDAKKVDFEDFDASQPDLFNSPAYKVSTALDSVFGCR